MGEKTIKKATKKPTKKIIPSNYLYNLGSVIDSLSCTLEDLTRYLDDNEAKEQVFTKLNEFVYYITVAFTKVGED